MPADEPDLWTSPGLAGELADLSERRAESADLDDQLRGGIER